MGISLFTKKAVDIRYLDKKYSTQIHVFIAIVLLQYEQNIAVCDVKRIMNIMIDLQIGWLTKIQQVAEQFAGILEKLLVISVPNAAFQTTTLDQLH